MYPTYNLHQRKQMPYTPQYYPSFEAVPPQMKEVDPAWSPVTYNTWPYIGNYCYPHPVECHGCWNHNYFPGCYGYRPSYHRFPSPSPHCNGSYTFPGAYPIHYFPPPDYSVEQPRYDYEKNMSRKHHCCGCPNHLCNQKEHNNVKIEEHNHKAEKKSNDSLVPFRVGNHPCYVMNKEDRKPIESQEEVDKAGENLESFGQYPIVWNGWFPLDTSNCESLKQGGDDKRTQHKQNEDSSRFPFPLFWMPSKPEEMERNDLEESRGRENVQESPSHFQATPVKLPNTDDRMRKSAAGEENTGSEACLKLADKNGVRKVFPVIQATQHEEKKTSEASELKSGGIPVKHVDDSGERKLSENTYKRHSSSPPKSSQLPPVCLRVDPLPRRKSGNGSSRSPSPPGYKGKSQESSDCNSKSSLSSNVEGSQNASHSMDCRLENNKEVSTKQKADVGAECIYNEDQGVAHREQNNTEEEGEPVQATVKGQSGDGTSQIGEDKGKTSGKEEITDQASEVGRRKLSDAEAAVIIQSAYRGFDVRRWEPLKKLKQIARVSEQVAEIKSRIHALESSSGMFIDNKQRMAVGETIMSLLLKLDTIQGLHPSIRDMRKFVARELVSLQEKLDSVIVKKSEAQIEQGSAIKSMEDLSKSATYDACCEGGLQEANDKLSATHHDTKSVSVEPCQGQTPVVASDILGSIAMQTKDTMLVGKEVSEALGDKIMELPVVNVAESSKAEVQPLLELEDEQNVQVFGAAQVPIPETPENDEETSSAVEVIGPSSIVDDSMAMNKDSEANALEKMPRDAYDVKLDKNELAEQAQVIVDEDPDIQVSEKHVLTEMREDAVEQSGEVEVETDAVSPDVSQVGQQPLDTSEAVVVAGELAADKIGLERDEDVEARPEPEELQVEVQGREVGHVSEHGEVAEVEDKLGPEKEKEKELSEELLGQPQRVDEPAECLKTEESQLEKPSAENQIHDAEHKEDHGISDANDSYSCLEDKKVICEEKELSTVVTKKCTDQKTEVEEDNVLVVSGISKQPEEGVLSPLSPTASKGSAESEMIIESDRKLIEENEKLREMMEKLIAAGKEQLTVISNLSGRVKDLEKRLSRKKKWKMRRSRGPASGSSCIKPSQ